MKRILCVGLLAMIAMASAHADEVTVTKAWTRATVPGQDSASMQLTITSKKDATLIGVASGSAQSCEIHSMVMEGNVMKMNMIESVPLPAKTPVTLGADGTHVMLIGLKSPLRAGHKLPFALTVQFPNGRTAIIRELALIKSLEPVSNSAQMKKEPANQPDATTHQHEHQHQ